MNVLDILIEATMAGGDHAQRLQSNIHSLAVKSKDQSGRDIVTQADHESQTAIISVFKRRCPHVSLISEEKENVLEDARASKKIVVDPLDGTKNFQRGSPMWSTTTCYIEDGVLCAGVIYFPTLSKLVTAEKGQGCRINGKSHVLSYANSLHQSVVGMEWVYWLNDRQRRQLLAVMDKAAGTHALLCATGSVVEVLEGITAAYVHPNPPDIGGYIWDYAAGALALAEAIGCSIADIACAPDGGPLDWANSMNMEAVLAASPALLTEILDILQSVN